MYLFKCHGKKLGKNKCDFGCNSTLGCSLHFLWNFKWPTVKIILPMVFSCSSEQCHLLRHMEIRFFFKEESVYLTFSTVTKVGTLEVNWRLPTYLLTFTKLMTMFLFVKMRQVNNLMRSWMLNLQNCKRSLLSQSKLVGFFRNLTVNCIQCYRKLSYCGICGIVVSSVFLLNLHVILFVQKGFTYKLSTPCGCGLQLYLLPVLERTNFIIVD